MRQILFMRQILDQPSAARWTAAVVLACQRIVVMLVAWGVMAVAATLPTHAGDVAAAVLSAQQQMLPKVLPRVITVIVITEITVMAIVIKATKMV
jgi:uncharacterized protein (DUF486 family)